MIVISVSPTNGGTPLSITNILKIDEATASLSSGLLRYSSMDEGPVSIREKTPWAGGSRLKSTSPLIPRSSSVIYTDIV